MIGRSVGPERHANSPTPQDYSCIVKLHMSIEANIHSPISILVWKKKKAGASAFSAVLERDTMPVYLPHSLAKQKTSEWPEKEGNKAAVWLSLLWIPLCGSPYPWDAHFLGSWMGSCTCLCRCMMSPKIPLIHHWDTTEMRLHLICALVTCMTYQDFP